MAESQKQPSVDLRDKANWSPERIARHQAFAAKIEQAIRENIHELGQKAPTPEPSNSR